MQSIILLKKGIYNDFDNNFDVLILVLPNINHFFFNLTFFLFFSPLYLTILLLFFPHLKIQLIKGLYKHLNNK